MTGSFRRGILWYDLSTKAADRGGERLVLGSDGSAYYTSDHYKSFTNMDPSLQDEAEQFAIDQAGITEAEAIAEAEAVAQAEAEAEGDAGDG